MVAGNNKDCTMGLFSVNSRLLLISPQITVGPSLAEYWGGEGLSDKETTLYMDERDET